MQYMQKRSPLLSGQLLKMPVSAVQSEAQHENHIDIKMHEIYYHARASEYFLSETYGTFTDIIIPKSPTAQRITKIRYIY